MQMHDWIRRLLPDVWRKDLCFIKSVVPLKQKYARISSEEKEQGLEDGMQIEDARSRISLLAAQRIIVPSRKRVTKYFLQTVVLLRDGTQMNDENILPVKETQR